MPDIESVDAVNRFRADEHRDDVCPNPVPCPKCATTRNPDLVATCRVSHCEVFDVRLDPVSACETDGECRLRVSGCCECGGSTLSWDLIAINSGREARYAELTCDRGGSCPACAPIYPTDVEAYCGVDRHCDIRLAEARLGD